MEIAHVRVLRPTRFWAPIRNFLCKAAVVGAGLAANGGKGGARPRRGGAGLLRPGGPTNRPAFGGRAPRQQRARRWGEQPQAWPASRQAGRQGGGCTGPRKELHFIKELRSQVSAYLPRTAS